MKKYKKPEVVYERYELSQSVADCTWELVQNNDIYNCVGDASDKGIDIVLFTPTAKCSMTEQELEEMCYTTMAGGKVVFMS